MCKPWLSHCLFDQPILLTSLLTVRRSSEPTEPSDSGSECLSRQDTHEHAVSTIEEYRLDYHSARASASVYFIDF
jgi:hypothetical protein